jgi:hypothetical protein
MKLAALSVLALLVSLPLACEQPEDDSSADPIGQGAEDDDDEEEEPIDEEPGGSQFEDCVDATWAYTELMQSCDGGETTIADVEIVCDLEQRPESVWPRCIEETEAMTACGAEVGCAEWFTAACWDPYRAMTICFGEPDPGAEPPSGCAWPNDGECDEPEGTNLCPEGTDVDDCSGGGGGACDPEYCSGCDTTCDEYACYTCCYSCSGDSCEQSCDF